MWKKIKNFLDTSENWLFPLVIILLILFFVKDKIIELFRYTKNSVSAIGSTLNGIQLDAMVSELKALISEVSLFTNSKNDAILDILLPLSESDTYALINHFGTLRYTTSLNEVTFFPFGDDMTLFEILAHELDEDSKTILKNNKPFLAI